MNHAGKRLLIVARPMIESTLAAPLKEAGHKVAVVAQASDALHILGRSQIDLVLVDLNTLANHDLAPVLNRCTELGPIPLLVLAEPVATDKAVEALEAGAENIIFEPVDRDLLRLLVANSLVKKELCDECRTLRSRLARESVPGPNPRPSIELSREAGTRVAPLKKALEKPERRIILDALKTFDYNRLETARALRINRTTLYNKMKKLGLLNRKRSRKFRRAPQRDI